MHVIIGAGGSISDELAKLLTEKNIPVRQVARTERVYTHGTGIAADVSDPASVLRAVDGCEVAYLTVGLPYKLSVWESQWRPLMQNVVNACSQSRTRLIFVDNIYMLSDGSIPHMTEHSPMEPSSKKGRVRADVDNILLKAVGEGKLNGIIARAADFYGNLPPNKSVLLDLVIRRMVAGKKPQWFYTVDKKHSFTYIPDIARALYLLSITPDAFNQVWNLPTAPPLTLHDVIQLVNERLGSEYKPQVLNEFIIGILRLFIPPLKEMKELKYQVTQDYWLDSGKFEKYFNFTPTPYAKGIDEIVTALKANT